MLGGKFELFEAYTSKKGGICMVLMWVTTIGFAIMLGIVGWVFAHFINSTLNSEDSTRIDPLPKNNDH